MTNQLINTAFNAALADKKLIFGVLKNSTSPDRILILTTIFKNASWLMSTRIAAMPKMAPALIATLISTSNCANA